MVQGFKETEKALLLEMIFDFYNAEKTITRKVWFPKSQIRNDKPTDWIIEQKKMELTAMFSEVLVNSGYLVSIYDSQGNMLC